jgi:hypothetical protein
MRAGAAEVEARHRTAVVAVAERRARGEQLVERQRAVEDVAADQAEARSRSSGESAGADTLRAEARREASTVARSASLALARRRPSCGRRQVGAKCWQNRLATCAPGGASVSSSVEGISISTPARATSRPARVGEGAVHVASDGATRMPEVWCAAAAAGQRVKLGSSDSATFMRKVAEPHFQRAMRAEIQRQVGGGTEHREEQQLRIDVGRDGARLTRAVLEHDAGRARPLLDDHSRTGASFDVHAARARLSPSPA